MTTITTTRNPVHPGVILAEELDARALTPEAAATQLELPAALLHGLLAGTTPVSNEAAAAFERAWGTPAEVWLTLQRQFAAHPRNAHGGRRAGAGRKTSGLESRLLRITGTPEQLDAITAWARTQGRGRAAQATAELLAEAIKTR